VPETDVQALLERHAPRLVYDSMEAYFADSAAIWTDSPFTELRRADGTVLARAPQLSLGFLGPHTYGDGRPVVSSDAIGEKTQDYQHHAAALHRDPRYRDRAHTHARHDSAGHLWLQYWFFYYYNDFQLAGPLLSAGKHEGDWEMIQLRIGGDGKPDQAVYAQHKGAESKAWKDVKMAPGAPDTPLVYVARGSHASYFSAGTHWTGTWFDHADGHGPQIVPALTALSDSGTPWAIWPGSWGDTRATDSPLDSASPVGPAHHSRWGDPAGLAATALRLATARVPPAPAVPPAPQITVRRDGGGLRVSYSGVQGVGLVVAIRPQGSQEPALTYALHTAGPAGEALIEHSVAPGQAYEIRAATTAASGAASAATLAELPAR
jgi:hypothetical protein